MTTLRDFPLDDELEGGPQPVLPDTDEAATQPTEGTMKTWATTDAINGTLVHFRSKGIYASVTDDQGFLAFVARTIGAVGNTFTVAYTAPDIDEPLLVSVDGNHITVQLAADSTEVAATMTTDLGVPNADLEYTAQAAGAAGNDISVAYEAPTEDTPDTTAIADGNEIRVGLAGTVEVAATLDFEFDTDVKMRLTLKTGSLNEAPGGPTPVTASENDRWRLEVQGFSNGQMTPYDDLTGHFASGTWMIITGLPKTLQEVVDAWNSSPGGIPSFDFAEASVAPGSSGSDTVPSQGTVLGPAATGGLAETLTSTADDVKDAIEADVDAAALVAVAHAPGNNGSGLVTTNGPTNLSGGVSGGIRSTASEVKAAIEANAEAAALVNVVLVDDQVIVMSEMGEKNLDGGDDTTVLEGSVPLEIPGD